MSKMAEWRKAREEQRVLVAKKTIEKCLDMIAAVPDPKRPEVYYCIECTEYRPSKFMHTLECVKCGSMIEHLSSKARVEIYGEQHIIQPTDSTSGERESGSGVDRRTDQSGQSDQRPSEKRDYYAQFDAEAESTQR